MNTLTMQFIAQLRVYCSIFHCDDGQGIIDYALVIVLVAIALVGALAQVNESVSGVFAGIMAAVGGS